MLSLALELVLLINCHDTAGESQDFEDLEALE